MAHIIVDGGSCTRCGICSSVCTSRIIDPGEGNALPSVRDDKTEMCIRCGHCEAYCPSQALVLGDRREVKVPLPEGARALSFADLGTHLQKRRSVRHFTHKPVSKKTITELLDVARYAASGGNGQPVEWLVVGDRDEVRKMASLTAEWMKTLIGSDHPMSPYVPSLIEIFESGVDVICRDAPHLLFAVIPEDNPIAQVDAIIALSHIDIAAPSHGVGTCWAGFVAAAAAAFEPFKRELALPAGRKSAYAMMLGYPRYEVFGIPERKPLRVTWR